MFYSEMLLSKTGPLARVWLASNLDKRLTKRDCLQSNLEDSIDLIVDDSQAPMALRLSGQLLLGVVKIYKRKAGYLLDDCNEALLKIKMAFRPGNVDLPADQSHIVSAEALNLPDRITAVDLFANLQDPDLLLSQPLRRNNHDDDPAVLDWGTQSLITDSMDLQQPRKPALLLQDDDLDLDLGIDGDDTLEIGRRAPTVLDDSRREPTLLEDDGLDLGLNDDINFGVGDTSALPPIDDGDIPMNDLGLDDTAVDMAGLPKPAPERRRDTASPLEGELEHSFRPNESTLYDQTEELAVAPQRAKRRKVIQMDSQLEISTTQIKEQQTDHSKITKQPQFLPRDPLLLQLMNMQKNGGFVSNIFGDGRSMGWAPELRGVLSVDIIRSTGGHKRKRDSGVADLYSDEEAQDKETNEQQPQDEEVPRFDEDGAVQPFEDNTLGDLGPGSPLPNFDDTTMPLLHPADAGPVSQGTRHAVHLLREHFGPEGADSESHRKKTSVLLQDLVPEKRTTRRDATKMFFEVLVLATKDAVKVEQGRKEIGENIRIRAKRGLYGAWAEAGETQTADTEQEAGAAPAVAAAA